MEETLKEIERKDGVRLTWNVWPVKNTDYTKQSVPIACLYSPRIQTTVASYEPVFCQSPDCRSILNPYCQVNFQSLDWTCKFCSKRNMMPNHYKNLTPENLPYELLESNTTMEYVLSKESSQSPIFFFIVDVCFFDDERRALAIDAVITAFNNLPDDSIVGIVTFGTNIELFDLEVSTIRKSHLFSGKKEFINFQMEKLMQKFLVKKRDCTNFIDIVKGIKDDPFPTIHGHRKIRCTGGAISFVKSILTSQIAHPAKYLLFTQGPCTLGPGSVCSISLKESIRSYLDILRGKSVYYTSAFSFYTKLANEITALGHSLDIYSATLYDIGLYEMKLLSQITGGIIIMAQDFNREVYLSSVYKSTQSIGECDFSCSEMSKEKHVRCEHERVNCMDIGFNAKIKVITSSNLKFKGCIGQGSTFGSGWRINCLRKSTNFSLLFEPVGDTKDQELGYVQIITQYQRSNNKMVVRATTFARMFSSVKSNILSGFDQEASMVLQARMFTSKNEAEEEIDLIRRIDKLLVRFLKNYAYFQPGIPSSVNLSSSMYFFPNFVYFFRRSVLVLSEDISPDEGAYFRHLLSKQNVSECMTMIVPSLVSYHSEGDVSPVELDAKSLIPDTILLLDTFHNVVVWRGAHIAQWIKDGIHLQEKYSFLNDLINHVENKAEEIVSSRLPTPQYTICDQYESQERLLLSRVNPSVKGQIITDDIDYQMFYEFLCKLVVNTN